MTSGAYLALDLGEKRIGVAAGDTIGRLAGPVGTLQCDGTELVRLQTLLLERDAAGIVVGLPRNSAGDETKQTKWVRSFAELRLKGYGLPIYFQDESATSVLAERQLTARKKNFTKGDVDALAATIILQDFLDSGVV